MFFDGWPIWLLILAGGVIAWALVSAVAAVGRRLPAAGRPAGATGRAAGSMLGGLGALALVAALAWVLWYVAVGWVPSDEEADRETDCVQQANDAGLPRGQRWLDFVDRCMDEGR